MDRKEFYFKQPVTEVELNGAFDAVEQSIWRVATDAQLVGIASGMVGAQMSPTPTMAVSISGPGFAYDQGGERIFVPAPWQPQPNGLDLSVDSNLVPTAVGVGSERWLSVYVRFKRAFSDPRIDGSSNNIFFRSDESYEFVVVQGLEAAVGHGVRLNLDATLGILLFDVHRYNAQASILNSDIGTTRRQDIFAVTQSPVSLRAGTLRGGIVAILQALNDHINGVGGGAHPDTGVSSIARAGTPLALPAGSVGGQLDAIRGYIDGALQTTLTGYKIAYLFESLGADSGVAWATAHPLAGATYGDASTTFSLAGVPIIFHFAVPLLVGDIIDIQLDTTAATNYLTDLGLCVTPGLPVAGSRKQLGEASYPFPITLRGRFFNAFVRSSMDIRIVAEALSTPPAVSLLSDYFLSVTVYRPIP